MTATLEALQIRVAQLESAFAEVAKAKGIVGPAGKPGNIDAACVRASAEAKEATRAEFESTINTMNAIVRDGVAKIEAEHRSAEHQYTHFKLFVCEILTDQIVTVLRDYHLLNDNHEPTHWRKP